MYAYPLIPCFLMHTCFKLLLHKAFLDNCADGIELIKSHICLLQVQPIDRSGDPEERKARRAALAEQLQHECAAAEALVEALKGVSYALLKWIIMP